MRRIFFSDSMKIERCPCGTLKLIYIVWSLIAPWSSEFGSILIE